MDTVVIVDPVLWSLLIGSLIPLVVAVATKLQASSGLKAVLGAILGVISSIVVTLNSTAGNSFSWKLLAITAATTIITTVSTYVGIWQPATKINEKAAPRFGLGTDLTTAA